MKRAILITVLCAACDSEQTELSSAYEEAVVQTRSSQTIGEVSAPRALGAPSDPLTFLTDMEAFISAESDCAEITQSDDVISIDFGEEGCDYLGRTMTGALSAVITDDGSGVTAIAVELFALNDGIVTLDGSADALLTEEERVFSADLHVSHDADADPACDRDGEGEPPEGGEGEPPEGGEGEAPEEGGEGMGGPDGGEGMGGPPRPPAEVDMIGARSEAPLDGDFSAGVIVNGTREMTAEEGDATMSEIDLEIVSGELVPQAGSIIHSGPMGEVTMTFARVDDATIEVSVSGERGDESFEVDAVSGERL